MAKPMMILIAGPYRSGTEDDPEKIVANVQFMESFAWAIFRLGHIPVLGEWFALPLLALAGSKQPGDDAFNEVFHPVAERLLEKCDGVLRVGGPPKALTLCLKSHRKMACRFLQELSKFHLHHVDNISKK